MLDPDMLAEGGRPAARRHDPTGHEDCAREWDPCACHGDRLCLLGKAMKWMRQEAEHAQWLSLDEIPRLERLLASDEPIPWGRSFYDGVEEPQPSEADKRRRLGEWLRDGRLRVAMTPRVLRRWASEIWPLILANAAAERENLIAAAIDAAADATHAGIAGDWQPKGAPE
ncbi:MAG TPA: hypothetical protein VIV06_04195 [Candidatus Limnocylindrales bacterium]